MKKIVELALAAVLLSLPAAAASHGGSSRNSSGFGRYSGNGHALSGLATKKVNAGPRADKKAAKTATH